MHYSPVEVLHRDIEPPVVERQHRSEVVDHLVSVSVSEIAELVQLVLANGKGLSEHSPLLRKEGYVQMANHSISLSHQVTDLVRQRD